MYQPEIIAAFVSMFAMSLIILVGAFIWTKLEKNKDAKRTSAHFIKVCQSDTCKKLNDLMRNLMVQRLKFEDESSEINAVKERLKIMKNEVHFHDSSPILGRQEMFQCLRTTLVQHPNDIRGRRRANEARKILLYDVYKDNEIRLTVKPAKHHISDFAVLT